MAINIIKEKCIGCGQCFKACPQDAFEFEPYSGNKLGKVAKINVLSATSALQLVSSAQ